jgi:large subunit GTPase 1
MGRKEFSGKTSIVVGMIGYPNVGKSSTINCLLAGVQRVSVSATPGKTKHFQTLIVDEEVGVVPNTPSNAMHSIDAVQMTLCDSPGLVMPSFGFNTSEMLLNGMCGSERWETLL